MTRQKTHPGEEHVISEGTGLALMLATIPVFERYGTQEEALLHVYADMLTAGAGAYTRDGFTDALALLGTSLSVTADAGALAVRIQSTEENLSKSLALVKTMFRTPRFEAKELVRVKKHTVNALPLMREDARARAYQVCVNQLLEGDDIRRSAPPETFVRAVQEVSRADLQSLHAQITKKRWVYTAGGSAETISLIVRTASALSGETETLQVRRPVLKPGAREVHLINIPHKQNIEFTLGGALPLRVTDPEYAAFTFGMSVLALQGGFSGRLMSIVREKEGLTYSIYGKAEESTKDADGFWRIMTFFNPKDALRGITSTMREIERMRRNGITKDELVRFKAILTTRAALKEDSLIAKVGELHGLKEMGLTLDFYTLFRADIERMTTARVNTAVRAHLSTKHFIVSGAGPVSSVERELKKFQT